MSLTGSRGYSSSVCASRCRRAHIVAVKTPRFIGRIHRAALLLLFCAYTLSGSPDRWVALSTRSVVHVRSPQRTSSCAQCVSFIPAVCIEPPALVLFWCDDEQAIPDRPGLVPPSGQCACVCVRASATVWICCHPQFVHLVRNMASKASSEVSTDIR